MTENGPAAITPAKLRSGAPDALAALCKSRGAAVYAYCEAAVGPDDAAAVAAVAFAQLRLAILPPGTLTSGRQAEALLRSVTRDAAMAHAVNAAAGSERPASAGCDGRESEILGYVENTLTPADREAVDDHVADCRSCTAALQRQQAAEEAFNLKPGTAVPAPIAREILTALAGAAPVEGDETAVRDEALRLLTGDAGAAADAPAEPAEQGDPADDLSELAQPADAEQPAAPKPKPGAGVPPSIPGRPRPVRPAMPTAVDRGTSDVRPSERLRRRLPWAGREHFGPPRSAMLLRGVARLAAVVLAAGVAGALLGIGFAALTGGAARSPDPLVTTSSDPRTTPSAPPGGAAAATKLPIDVVSATVRAATVDGAAGARITVRVRVENAMGRVVRPERPLLLVASRRAEVSPDSGGAAGELLAPSLAAGATARGTLRFDVPSTTPRAVTTTRVRLQIFGKVVALKPRIGRPPAGP